VGIPFRWPVTRIRFPLRARTWAEIATVTRRRVGIWAGIAQLTRRELGFPATLRPLIVPAGLRFGRAGLRLGRASVPSEPTGAKEAPLGAGAGSYRAASITASP